MATPEEQFGVPDPEGEPREQPGALDPTREAEILSILSAYKSEAEQARSQGPNARDATWQDNWDLYWGRMDYSGKAPWQSTEVMPEAPQFIDRWAASMREALNQPGRWYSAVDPSDQNNELRPHIERFLEVLLSNAGSTPDGHPARFEAVFEDLMKLGAMMACSMTVTWQSDGSSIGGGRVSCDVADPRNVWIDHTGRGLYRRRWYEIDKHELERRARQTDSQGQPIYWPDAVEALKRQESQERDDNREATTGHAQAQSSPRQPVQIDEWLATIVNNDGEVLERDALIVVANDKYIVRGPEPIPFWHGRDWLIFAAMVSVPLSVYGRSYMEDWSSIARSFIEMTNLIMDGTFTSTMNAFAMVPEMLEDPTQAQEGVTPNKTYTLEEGYSARDFVSEIELGSLPPEAITVWQGLKAEMREGAKLSEIALGQVPPKGDITATEISAVTQSGSSLVRSMARTIEARVLEPALQLIWQTGLQHVNFSDPQIRSELGEETADMLAQRRAEFRDRQIRFQVHGLSSLVDRQQKLQNLLSALQTIGTSEPLLAEFSQKYDFGKLMDELLRLYGVDTLQLEPTEREKMIRAIIARQQQGAEQPRGRDEPRRPRETDNTGGTGTAQA